MTEREELTADERSLLESLYIPGADAPGRKALRLLDARQARIELARWWLTQDAADDDTARCHALAALNGERDEVSYD